MDWFKKAAATAQQAAEAAQAKLKVSRPLLKAAW